MSWLSDILSIGGLGSSALAPLGKDLTSEMVQHNLNLRAEKLYTRAWQSMSWVGDPILHGGSNRAYQGVPEKKTPVKPKSCQSCGSRARDTFKINADNYAECTYCGSVY